LKLSAAEVTDEQLESYVNYFLKRSSPEFGWSMHKYEIKYDISIVNPTSRTMNLMKQWTEISTTSNLQEILQQRKGMKAWRKGMVKNFRQQLSKKT